MEGAINSDPRSSFLTGPADSEHAAAHGAFRSALARGETPRIEDYLRNVAPQQRPALFKELLEAETELRSRTKKAPSRDEYAQRFREFASIVDTVFSAGQGTQHDPFATQAKAPDSLSQPAALDAELPIHCGRFRIVKTHARGGLGEVFIAEDGELRRNVALKRIRGGFIDDSESRSRFVREAEITGNLEHPGIVPIYGLGIDDDGCPYYAMRFIEGESLQETIRRFHDPQRNTSDAAARQLELRKLLQRFIDVCNAMEYAHSRGVIHRDLKPANIMVGKFGETLVVDWGLAKQLGQADEDISTIAPGSQTTTDDTPAPTQLGQAVGTPQYMSPEQAEGRHYDLTAATDVYALGAVLYAILSGRPPIDGKSLGEVLMNVVRGRSAPLPRSTPGALASICRRAMALQPTDRYPSARALVDDLEKWLADDRVEAHRESFVESASRWARTHRAIVTGGVALAATALVALVIGLIAVSSEQRETERQRRTAESERRRAEAERTDAEAARLQESTERKRADHQRALAEALKKDAEDQKDRAEWTAYLANILAADAEWDRNQPLSAAQRLDACPPKFRGWEHDYLTAKFRRGRTELNNMPGAKALAFSPDGSHFVAGMWGKNLLIADTKTKGVRALPTEIPLPHAVAYSPDGKSILSGHIDKSMRLTDVASGAVIRTFEQEPDVVASVAFSSDGKRCVAGCLGGHVRMRSVETGELIPTQLRLPGNVISVAFTRDDRRLLASGGPVAVLWDLAAEREVRRFAGNLGNAAAALSPDEKRLVSCGSGGVIKLWNAESGDLLVELRGHATEVSGLAFSPDGRLLVSTGRDTTMKLWDLQNGRIVRSFVGHSRPIQAVAFSPRGDRIVSGGYDQLTILWEVDVPEEPRSLATIGNSTFAVALSPDTQIMALAGNPGIVHLRRKATGQNIRSLPTLPAVPVIWDVSFDAGGDRIAAGYSDGAVRVWNTATGELLQTMRGHDKPVLDLAYSRDGKRIASYGGDGTAKLWNVDTGNEITVLEKGGPLTGAVDFSPDSKIIAVTAVRGTVVLRRADSGQMLGLLQSPARTPTFQCLAFSPDGTHVAAGSGDDAIRLWRMEEPEMPKVLKGHTGMVATVSFSPDGKRIASGGEDRTIKLWDVATGAETLTLRGHQSQIKKVVFSSRGDEILSCEAERVVKLWSAVDDRSSPTAK